MNLYFTYESRDTLKSFSLFLAVKTITKLNMEDSVKFEIEILSHRRSRSPDNTKFDHFTLFFFAEDAQKFTKIYNTRAQPLLCS